MLSSGGFAIAVATKLIEHSLIKSSVPNLISYLHDFLWNFSQFLAIYFKLFSSGGIFNSENVDEWVPPVRRRCPRRACLVARRCRVAATCRAHALNALSGPRAGVLTAPHRSDQLSEPPRLALSRPRRRRCLKPRRRPCLKLINVRLSPPSRDLSTVSVARALLSPFSSVEHRAHLPLPPLRRRTAAGHRSPTSSEKRHHRAGFLTLTVDEELR
jgi:hypothetical protein